MQGGSERLEGGRQFGPAAERRRSRHSGRRPGLALSALGWPDGGLASLPRAGQSEQQQRKATEGAGGVVGESVCGVLWYSWRAAGVSRCSRGWGGCCNNSFSCWLPSSHAAMRSSSSDACSIRCSIRGLRAGRAMSGVGGGAQPGDTSEPIELRCCCPAPQPYVLHGCRPATPTARNPADRQNHATTDCKDRLNCMHT